MRSWVAFLALVSVTLAQQCGRPSNQPITGSNYMAEEDRIVGGRIAKANSWPWQVSLQTSRGHNCGGTLVSNQWIITAAHCLNNIWSLNIKLGEHNLNINDPGEITIPSAMLVTHPSYSAASSVNDIAMIKLQRPVTFSSTIQPACLPSSGASLGAGQYVYVTGWGHTGSVSVSTVLKQTMVPVVEYNQCARMSPRYVSPNSICTGYSTGGHNPCFGDSGGPLVYPSGGAWYLHGVVSWGPQRCAIPSEPAIFVKVSMYLPWIQSTMARY